MVSRLLLILKVRGIHGIKFHLIAGKFRREFRNVLERGHCLTLKQNQRNNHWQSQYRSRYVNDDQEHSFIHSTTHMVHVTPSLKKNFNCAAVSENCSIKCHKNHN